MPDHGAKTAVIGNQHMTLAKYGLTKPAELCNNSSDLHRSRLARETQRLTKIHTTTMDILCLPLFTRLAILALLLAPSSAQDKVTIPDTDSCRVDFDVNAPVNATGSLNIHWNALMMDPTRNDWTLSLTYNDTRGQNGTLHQWDSYLSAPEGNEAKACVFMFAGLNKTSSSDQRSGCNGVIDEACVTVLREFNNIQGDCTWPAPLDEFTDRVRQACGTNFLSTGPQTYRG